MFNSCNTLKHRFIGNICNAPRVRLFSAHKDVIKWVQINLKHWPVVNLICTKKVVPVGFFFVVEIFAILIFVFLSVKISDFRFLRFWFQGNRLTVPYGLWVKYIQLWPLKLLNEKEIT